MTIFLDFDGTMVEHEFPKIGREVPHAMRVVKRLKEKGHKIILNTMRCEFDSKKHLASAIDWIHFHIDIELEVDGVTTQKAYPEWKPNKDGGILFIDDSACGTPLIDNVMTPGKMVDWLSVEKILEETGIL